REIVRASGMPVLVDADTGYGGVLNTTRTVRELADAGAAAIQLEDQELPRSEEHTSELQSRFELVCRLLLEKKNGVINALDSFAYFACPIPQYFVHYSSRGHSDCLSYPTRRSSDLEGNCACIRDACTCRCRYRIRWGSKYDENCS